MDTATLYSLIKVALFAGMIAVLIACVVWARRGGGKVRALLGGTVLLLFGSGVVPPRDLQVIEETRDEKGKKGAESGDPPAPPESATARRPS